jgi:hypothetical protein
MSPVLTKIPYVCGMNATWNKYAFPNVGARLIPPSSAVYCAAASNYAMHLKSVEPQLVVLPEMVESSFLRAKVVMCDAEPLHPVNTHAHTIFPQQKPNDDVTG